MSEVMVYQVAIIAYMFICAILIKERNKLLGNINLVVAVLFTLTVCFTAKAANYEDIVSRVPMCQHARCEVEHIGTNYSGEDMIYAPQASGVGIGVVATVVGIGTFLYKVWSSIAGSNPDNGYQVPGDSFIYKRKEYNSYKHTRIRKIPYPDHLEVKREVATRLIAFGETPEDVSWGRYLLEEFYREVVRHRCNKPRKVRTIEEWEFYCSTLGKPPRDLPGTGR